MVEDMLVLKKSYLMFVVATLLLAVSAILIGPVAWRWGKRQVVRVQSSSRWDKWCAKPNAKAHDGDPCGWLKIPSCGIDTIVLSGDSKVNLAKSVCMERLGQGAIEGDGVCGSVDRACCRSLRIISGHRDTHFRKLRHVVAGDRLTFGQDDGSVLHYRVADIDIIASGKLDEYLAGQRHPSWVVLLTCYPFRYIGSAPERYVVWCEPF